MRGETSLDAEEEDGGAQFAAPAGRSPADVTEWRERAGAVRRAVNALPPELRSVVVMKEFEDLTFQEIADALGIPLSTVKSRLYTALKQLRLRLEKHNAPSADAARI